MGTSGWAYPEWRGGFYPKGLAQKRELEYLAGQVNSIELNGTFYSLRRPSDYRSWHSRTPDDFVFAAKGPMLVTHRKRLVDTESALKTFFDSGPLELGTKLGPILWQLPPSLPFDPGVFEAFLSTLTQWPHRNAIEPRHASFRNSDFFALLRKYGVASVIADTAGRFPRFDEQTADFAYVRLHGHEELYASDYSDELLDVWARTIRGWSGDVYVYFDNTMRGAAPRNALSLSRRLGLNVPLHHGV
ncbi:DUF72 domain-containing protein [Amycolatopsis xylanica]|uniref:DUF72 domain-containing protein n=1 Tax=Amycolatopsis xylanica TaxID=589385 RepID=UPI001C409F33|nr:DUF72 domain-containing protein [Amycolatopsis xylanica]